MGSVFKTLLKFLEFLPPVLLFSFILVNFYFFFISEGSLGLCIAIYSSTLIVLWSFFQCLRTHPGKVPAYFDFIEDSYKLRVFHSDYKTDLRGAVVTFCEKCLKGRPARAHHCSYCGECILKRDHHCMWIKNCVGLNNHKHFLHMLAYGALSTCMISCFLGQNLLENYEKSSFFDICGFWLNFTTCICLTFMTNYHLWLILTNRTQFDLRWSIKSSPFDLSAESNLRSQLGEGLFWYFFPVTPSLSAIFFPTKLTSTAGAEEIISNRLLVINKD